VICSRVASLPEVAGDAAVMIDPNSQEEMVESMRRVIGDETLRQDMRQKGLVQAKKFSWRESGQRVLSLLEKLGCQGGAE
jgi:glycosyltransferase involved in cell wall biosynthesis